MESKQNILIRRFYRGDDWKIARAMKIAAVGGSLFQSYQNNQTADRVLRDKNCPNILDKKEKEEC